MILASTYFKLNLLQRPINPNCQDRFTSSVLPRGTYFDKYPRLANTLGLYHEPLSLGLKLFTQDYCLMKTMG